MGAVFPCISMRNILEELRNDIEGVKLLRDWLGEGTAPVAQEEAERRATICTTGNDGKPCPLNKHAGWWDTVKHEIADVIRAEIELKNHLELHVQNENELHVCVGCGCALPLKVWTPMEYIKAHTDVERFKDAPAYCWIRQSLGV